MSISSGSRRLPTATVVLSALVASATVHAQIESGPTQQRAPWRAPAAAGAPGHTFNSVVQVTSAAGLGTGTVIGKRTDRAGNAWVCVLTADHVVRGAPNVSVRFGDGGAQGTFGGAGMSTMRQVTPRADMNVVGINMGALAGNAALQNFYASITPVATHATTAAGLRRFEFTELGYGGSGTFVQGGMQATTTTAVAPFSLSIDNNKRFQNNKFERTIRVNSGPYQYTAIQWDFNRAAAAAPVNPFLVAEGLSFAGDSGGPYLFSHPDEQAVGAFVRPDDADGTVVPDWPGGNMPVFTDFQVAVHTMGNSVPGGAGGSATRFNPYDTTWGAGIPINARRHGLIQRHCDFIPAPGSASILAVAGVLAFRRRR